MLRTKEGSIRRHHAPLMTTCATLMMISITLATALLYSSTSLAGKPKAQAPAPCVASLPNASAGNAQKSKSDQSASDADSSAAKPVADQQAEMLFARGPFDLSILHHADDGAALVRLGEILQHPEIAPLVDGFNTQITNSLQGWLKTGSAVDLRQVEWIAFCTTVTFKHGASDQTEKHDEKSQDKDGPGNGSLWLGAGYMYIHMTHAANWQQIVLDSVPGSTLETFEGKHYVHMPKISFLGLHGFRLRFPDDRTVVWAGDFKPEDAEEANKLFFDEKPRTEPYAWESTWRGVEGGLFTVVIDHSKDGMSKLPKPKLDEYQEQFLPLVDQAKYYAAGWDCTEKSLKTGMKVRATCADEDTVQKFNLAASLLLNRWPDLFQDNPENLEAYHTRLIQFFSGLKIQGSSAGSDQHFVEVGGEAELKEGELTKLLPQMLGNL